MVNHGSFRHWTHYVLRETGSVKPHQFTPPPPLCRRFLCKFPIKLYNILLRIHVWCNMIIPQNNTVSLKLHCRIFLGPCNFRQKICTLLTELRPLITILYTREIHVNCVRMLQWSIMDKQLYTDPEKLKREGNQGAHVVITCVLTNVIILDCLGVNSDIEDARRSENFFWWYLCTIWSPQGCGKRGGCIGEELGGGWRIYGFSILKGGNVGEFVCNGWVAELHFDELKMYTLVLQNMFIVLRVVSWSAT